MTSEHQLHIIRRNQAGSLFAVKDLKATIFVAVSITLFGIYLARADGPDYTTATFGDWSVACIQPANGPKTCELAHTIVAEGQQNPVGQINISRANKIEPYKVIIQIPPNVWLAAGVRLVFDEKAPAIPATLRWCINTRCRADADLTDTSIKAMRRRTEPGSVQYKEATERDVSTPVSFRGFAQALDWMEKQ
jgi:invasion protein IalB